MFLTQLQYNCFISCIINLNEDVLCQKNAAIADNLVVLHSKDIFLLK